MDQVVTAGAKRWPAREIGEVDHGTEFFALDTVGATYGGLLPRSRKSSVFHARPDPDGRNCA